MFRALIRLLLLVVLFCGQSASGQSANVRKEAALLRGHWNSSFREIARACDSVRVTYNWYLADGHVVHVIRTEGAIKSLLDALEVVEDHNGSSVGCFGSYRYEFMRDGKVIADISEACSALFWRDGIWVGTPSMTSRGQKSLQAWVRLYFAAE